MEYAIKPVKLYLHILNFMQSSVATYKCLQVIILVDTSLMSASPVIGIFKSFVVFLFGLLPGFEFLFRFYKFLDRLFCSLFVCTFTYQENTKTTLG